MEGDGIWVLHVAWVLAVLSPLLLASYLPVPVSEHDLLEMSFPENPTC